jgi:hypothetical protein
MLTRISGLGLHQRIESRFNNLYVWRSHNLCAWANHNKDGSVPVLVVSAIRENEGDSRDMKH